MKQYKTLDIVILNLKEYNESRLDSSEILSGKEYRRKLRKERSNKSKLI